MTLLQIDGGPDAAYVLAVNDSFVSNQADWRVIREEVSPTVQSDPRFLYDLTEEKPLGKLRPVRCDLENTTVRVYGILTAELTAIDVRCRQKLESGQRLPVSVSFQARDGRRLAGVAEQIKTQLAAQGVTVEILTKPEMAPYSLAYEVTPEQKAENDRVEKGEVIGRVKRLTSNGNDWFGGSTGYCFARPLILLDVAGAKGNELAQSLESKGMLWPEVGPAFPGPGRAVVQCVSWAFGPRGAGRIVPRNAHRRPAERPRNWQPQQRRLDHGDAVTPLPSQLCSAETLRRRPGEAASNDWERRIVPRTARQGSAAAGTHASTTCRLSPSIGNSFVFTCTSVPDGPRWPA